jgi:hypothetical protein
VVQSNFAQTPHIFSSLYPFVLIQPFSTWGSLWLLLAAMEKATAAPATTASSSTTPQAVEMALDDDLPRLRLDWKEIPVHGKINSSPNS